MWVDKFFLLRGHKVCGSAGHVRAGGGALTGAAITGSTRYRYRGSGSPKQRGSRNFTVWEFALGLQALKERGEGLEVDVSGAREAAAGLKY